ncbi:rhomboid domain-containing protein 3 [Gouania willdenowi]|uniref:Peptidase S54 rhomboid domain-containing protein n=1 Tax=Gouania willdenowi TaxID=441366 RepID=A0A8C5G9V0_GOUWI|nr:rhomboid domain-containing protein 3 [Gouania willdenowi]
MAGRLWSSWLRFGSDRPGFFLGTSILVFLMVLVYTGGIQASLSVGPEGELPRLRDVFLYALSHDDVPSLVVSVSLLLTFGPCQERCWGTVAFGSLSILTMATLPCVYTLVLFVGWGDASRICGYASVQLALITAQCGQVTQRRFLRCVPVWFVPWFILMLSLLLLPATPALFNLCAICIGHNYRSSLIVMLQDLEETRLVHLLPSWIYVPIKLRLPTHVPVQRYRTPSHTPPAAAAAAHQVNEGVSAWNPHPWTGAVSAWVTAQAPAGSEEEVLEEQMLRAGIQASLQDLPDDPQAKVEVPKSSVSSLRLQQLEKMGFPTDKAVVALAASKQLDGAIALLIEDSVGEQAVVVSKGKSPVPPP